MELPVAKIELPAEIPSCVGVKGGGGGDDANVLHNTPGGT